MKFYFIINRYLITKDSISVLIDTLHVCTQSLQTEPTPVVYQSVTELFRTLRNSCADCSKNQDIISEFPTCFCDISVIIKTLTDHNIREEDGEQIIVLLRCLVQFLGNSVTKHAANQGHVTTHNLQYFRFVVFMMCTYLCPFEKHSYCCQIVHLCTSDCKEVKDIMDTLGHHSVGVWMHSASKRPQTVNGVCAQQKIKLWVWTAIHYEGTDRVRGRWEMRGGRARCGRVGAGGGGRRGGRRRPRERGERRGGREKRKILRTQSARRSEKGGGRQGGGRGR